MNHQQRHLEKILQFLILQQGHDLRPHLLQFHAWKWRPCQGTQHVFQCQNNSKKLTHLSKHVVNCRQRTGQANSEDPFTVVVMTGKLIISCKKFPLFAQCFYNKMRQFSVDNTPQISEVALAAHDSWYMLQRSNDLLPSLLLPTSTNKSLHPPLVLTGKFTPL